MSIKSLAIQLLTSEFRIRDFMLNNKNPGVLPGFYLRLNEEISLLVGFYIELLKFNFLI